MDFDNSIGGKIKAAKLETDTTFENNVDEIKETIHVVKDKLFIHKNNTIRFKTKTNIQRQDLTSTKLHVLQYLRCCTIGARFYPQLIFNHQNIIRLDKFHETAHC